MFKRMALFLVVNIVVVASVSLALSLFNVRPYLTAYGLNIKSLAIFCLIWGMAGSLISLQLSRKMAKWLMRIQLVDGRLKDEKLNRLYRSVALLADRKGLPMPEVGIFESVDVNAFATGPSKRRSLVAVSTALLNKMSDTEMEAILAHEMSHIANGDMVTMTLLQGIVNAFVMFFARLLAFALSSMGRGNNRRGSPLSYYLSVFVFEIIFMLIGSMIIAAYSRFREYRADKGGAELAGKTQMIQALRHLKGIQREKFEGSKRALAPFMIQAPRQRSIFSHLFSTHPALDKRIARLENLSPTFSLNISR
ncbi:MAG: protease HtpX [Simkaniaceae bacterium]